MFKNYIKVQDIARELSVSRATSYRIAHQCEILFLNGGIRVARDSFEKWKREHLLCLTSISEAEFGGATSAKAKGAGRESRRIAGTRPPRSQSGESSSGDLLLRPIRARKQRSSKQSAPESTNVVQLAEHR